MSRKMQAATALVHCSSASRHNQCIQIPITAITGNQSQLPCKEACYAKCKNHWVCCSSKSRHETPHSVGFRHARPITSHELSMKYHQGAEHHQEGEHIRTPLANLETVAPTCARFWFTGQKCKTRGCSTLLPVVAIIPGGGGGSRSQSAPHMHYDCPCCWR